MDSRKRDGDTPVKGGRNNHRLPKKKAIKSETGEHLQQWIGGILKCSLSIIILPSLLIILA